MKFSFLAIIRVDNRVIYGLYTPKIFLNLMKLTIVSLMHLKPTGYVMHQQFNIQQLYALPTLYLCVLYLSENKQRLVPLTA
jgi:hypothetical protein